MTDREFVYADCPINEQGHRMAKTRDGRDVRLLCDDAPIGQPIVALMNGTACYWNVDGHYSTGYGTCGADLMPAKRTRVVWINLYPDGSCAAHPSEKTADCFIACRIGPARRVEIEE